MSTNQSNDTPYVTQEQLSQVLAMVAVQSQQLTELRTENLRLTHQQSNPPPRYNSVPPEHETFLEVDNDETASGSIASARSVTDSVRSSERSLPGYPASWDSSGIGPARIPNPTWEQFNEMQLKIEQLQRENQRQK